MEHFEGQALDTATLSPSRGELCATRLHVSCELNTFLLHINSLHPKHPVCTAARIGRSLAFHGHRHIWESNQTGPRPWSAREADINCTLPEHHSAPPLWPEIQHPVHSNKLDEETQMRILADMQGELYSSRQTHKAFQWRKNPAIQRPNHDKVPLTVTYRENCCWTQHQAQDT
jgi:hypothetical protein